MSLRLSIVLAQLETSNISENLLNEIFQIIYYLHEPKQITKKVYNSKAITQNKCYFYEFLK